MFEHHLLALIHSASPIVIFVANLHSFNQATSQWQGTHAKHLSHSEKYVWIFSALIFSWKVSKKFWRKLDSATKYDYVPAGGFQIVTKIMIYVSWPHSWISLLTFVEVLCLSWKPVFYASSYIALCLKCLQLCIASYVYLSFSWWIDRIQQQYLSKSYNYTVFLSMTTMLDTKSNCRLAYLFTTAAFMRSWVCKEMSHCQCSLTI